MDSLTSVILTPVFTAVLLLLIPGNYRVVLRALDILGSAATAWAAAGQFARFQAGHGALQFESLVPWVTVGPLNVAYHVGADGLNIGLILATGLVGFAAVLASWNIERHVKLFYVLLMLMIAGAMGAFASLDLFFFYFFT